MKFVVTTREPGSDTANYIHSTSDIPTLKQAMRMLSGDKSWQQDHVQTAVPYPAGAKQMGPVQALATMLGEMARGREVSMQVYGKQLPILPHLPYHMQGNRWFTFDHAGQEITCPDPTKVVPLLPAPV